MRDIYQDCLFTIGKMVFIVLFKKPYTLERECWRRLPAISLLLGNLWVSESDCDMICEYSSVKPQAASCEGASTGALTTRLLAASLLKFSRITLAYRFLSKERLLAV